MKIMNKVLERKEAEHILEQSYNKNPGPWKAHSIAVAINAEKIAEGVAKNGGNMNSDTAYVCGLLHDIGRRAGQTAFMHTLDGFNYLKELGYDDVARICLTHSFPVKDIMTYFGEFDCSDEQRSFVETFLSNAEYDDYDRLIQLCDAISLPQGACLMEKRLIDVALRHGIPDFTIEKWKAFLQLKQYFDELCNCNIYQLLPNRVETTFGFEIGK